MRRRILLLVVGMTLLVVLSFAIPLALLIRSQTEQDAKNSTIARAQSVAYLLRGNPTAAQIAAVLAQLPQTIDHSTSVGLPDGTVLGRAVAALPSRPSARPTGPTGGATEVPGSGPPNGPADVANGQPQLVSVPGGAIATAAVRGADGTSIVMVYLSDAALHAGQNEKLLLLGGGSVGLLLIGLIGGELLTRRIVRPLLVTAQTAHRISAGDVTARAPTTGPREVAAVGSALNLLADRIDELIAEERETVADLSHRLRTPLTSLRLDAEALRDPSESARVGSHVNDLERMLTAIIRAARRPQREGRLPGSDATAVVGDRVRFWSALADDQNRPRQVSLPSGVVSVRASAEDLGAAVDALLENIIAHTPEGSAFSVHLSALATGAKLVIADDGPGLPADASIRGRSDRGSSGLGLDIARRCAEASGGSMSIDRSSSGGTRITLLLNSG